MNRINIVVDELNNVYLETVCPMCGKRHDMKIEERNVDSFLKDFNDWRNGKLIQDSFPYFTPSQREFLMTGICDSCWDKMM